MSGIPLDVAIALLFVLWTKWLVLPALTPVAPTAFGIQWREMLRAESVAVRVLPEIAGAALGVLTHLLWDGFTHRGWWPASVFWGDVRLLQMPLTEWLWLISTAFGSLAVWMFLRKRFAAPLARIDFNGPLLRLFVLVLCASVVGWRVGVRVMRGDEALSRWNGTVLAAGCGLVALSMWCTWRRIRGHS